MFLSILIGKINTVFRKYGLKGFIIVVIKRVVSSLDRCIFFENAFLFIRSWMINRFFYKIVAGLKLREGEHQVGRLLNMKLIFEDIKQRKIDGDIIEFGTYKGFSLMWLIKYRNKYIPSAKILAVDSFQGLPCSSTVWSKGMFSDTDYKSVINRISKRKIYKRDVYIVKGLFSEDATINKIREILVAGKGILVAHIDCDLGSSAVTALEIIERINKDKNKKEFFLLFDDWFNHPEEIPLAFERFIGGRKDWKCKEVLSTRLTKYFYVKID